MIPVRPAEEILEDILVTQAALRDEVIAQGQAGSPKERLQAELDVCQAELALALYRESRAPASKEPRP